jgi:hypothetical protein
MVTSHHVHLLAFDIGGRNVIPDSIKLAAGRTGHEYDVRKNRKGAFWEDRYHATAVEKNRYFGSKAFIEKMKEALGFRAKGRKIICTDDTFELWEVLTPYGKANNLDSGNTFLWNQPIDRLRIYRPLPSLIGQFLHEN